MKRIGLAILVALLIGVVAWFALQTSDPPAAALAGPRDEPRRSSEQPSMPRGDASVDAPARAAAIDENTAPAPKVDAPPPELVLHGKVVDERRFPVAGADVTLQLGGSAQRTTRSGADGSFTFEFAELPSGSAAHVWAWARLGDSSAGVVSTWIVGKQPSRTGFRVPNFDPHDRDLGSIVLLPASPLHVAVRDAGQPAALARVFVEFGRSAEDVLAFESDQRGELDLPPLPRSRSRLRAALDGKEGSAIAFVPEQASAVIELAPLRTIALTVVDSANGAAIANAEIKINESMQAPAGATNDPDTIVNAGEVVYEQPRADLTTTTDAEGRAQLHLPSTIRPRLKVTAPGYLDFPQREQRAPKLDDGVAEKRIEMLARNARTVRWPIIAGELPPPPDGSKVTLHLAAGMSGYGSEPRLPPPGRMEGTTLVVDGVDAFVYLAEAEDGALARLWLEEAAAEGEPTSFRRGRRIEVLVRDGAGNPIAGAVANARNQGNNALCDWVPTDADGRAWLTRLYDGLADVYVATRGEASIGANAGSVNLDQGDGRIEYTLPARSTALVRTIIDGEPRLPAKCSVRSQPACRVVEELPEQGMLRIELVANPGARTQCWLSALDFLPVQFIALAGERGSETVVDVPLQRAATLIAQVTLPREPRVIIHAERWDEKKNEWANPTPYANGRTVPNGPDGTFVFAGCELGRWRVREKNADVASNEIELTPALLEGRVVLDLASVEWVQGRVEVPAGEDQKSVVVLVEGGDSKAKESGWLPGISAPEGTHVSADGSFRARIPGDRNVTVRPWHPWLAPALEGGTISTRSGRDGVVLRLEASDEVRLPVPQFAPSRDFANVRIGLYRERVDGEPLRWIFAPVIDGTARFGGLEPGRWTLWIDPLRDFAPLVLENVEVKAGVNELESARFEAGASIRVRVQVTEGQSAPRVFLSARANSAPAYQRFDNSDSNEELVVTGFAAGSFTVNVQSVMNFRGREEPRTVELDGRGELVLDFDPRK